MQRLAGTVSRIVSIERDDHNIVRIALGDRTTLLSVLGRRCSTPTEVELSASMVVAVV